MKLKKKRQLKIQKKKKNHSSQCELNFQTRYSCHEIIIALYKSITKKHEA